MAQPLLDVARRTVATMIEGLFNQPNMVAAKRLLDVSSMRHQAIAVNLANVDTPGYRRIDVAEGFEQQLRGAIGARDVLAMQRAQPALGVDPNAVARKKDGNTVDLETELVHMSRNAIEHSAEIHLLTGSLLRLRLAITGRAG